jgi:hypothetical protein
MFSTSVTHEDALGHASLLLRLLLSPHDFKVALLWDWHLQLRFVHGVASRFVDGCCSSLVGSHRRQQAAIPTER